MKELPQTTNEGFPCCRVIADGILYSWVILSAMNLGSALIKWMPPFWFCTCLLMAKYLKVLMWLLIKAVVDVVVYQNVLI